jgi:hypothetical protein
MLAMVSALTWTLRFTVYVAVLLAAVVVLIRVWRRHI